MRGLGLLRNRLKLTLPMVTVSGSAEAAESSHHVIGADLSLAWTLPFVGVLLSIALFPLLAPHFWEHHHGKVSAFWSLVVVVALGVAAGPQTALHAVAHTALVEYIPFILLSLALYTVAGGILVRGNIHGSPATNTGLLALGALLASFIGTTGASMVMIRPMIRANDDRRHNVHVVVFFIFLVSNIGGSLTPLGDPPLFLGFLRGVDFFWTTRHLLPQTLFLSFVLLALFFALDSWFCRRESAEFFAPDPTPDRPRIGVRGLPNVALIFIAVGAILMSGAWDPDLDFRLLGAEIEFQNVVRDLILIGVVLASLRLTPRADRE